MLLHPLLPISRIFAAVKTCYDENYQRENLTGLPANKKKASCFFATFNCVDKIYRPNRPENVGLSVISKNLAKGEIQTCNRWSRGQITNEL